MNAAFFRGRRQRVNTVSFINNYGDQMIFRFNNVNSFTSEWRRFSYGDHGHNQTTWWWARKLFGCWRWCNYTAGYGSIQDHQWRQKGTIAWPACSPVASIVRPSQNGRKRLFSDYSPRIGFVSTAMTGFLRLSVELGALNDGVWNPKLRCCFKNLHPLQRICLGYPLSWKL